jgi:predicted RNase H-like HicB family nuclease
MLIIDVEREEDGRWLAEVPALPGVLAYGTTSDDAKAKVKVLALRVIADRFEPLPREVSGLFEAA